MFKEPKKSDARLNITFTMAPLCLLLLAYAFPTYFEMLAFGGWIIGGVLAMIVLFLFAWTSRISSKNKEAALSFLLGEMIVFGFILLKPV